ncbi:MULTISPECIES: alpha/beta hydrolase family protein [unclassified Arthrobacter]|uniref:alpha/beta hydrolase family protein n=1 Tax=unclassified Arthrobacter TaxID=235627 RepID=UPI002E07EC8A|nr:MULTISPECIES: alpha/beta hydrolase [unclassified Arthrobacter]MEC5193442.1 pimeloyl-ACP methyl ester carboxylesterase [Arthrobacter sp. MP_M4]MEC5204918.1 pimeloyl-ACP methyl ester carboxylesterase [Arthrobacter sp. MP_M7]
MEPIVRERTRVRTAGGDLEALIHYRPSPFPQPGLVLVDGSGDGTADGWGGAVDLLVSCGAVVLTHDKPGCGGSSGDWRTQSLTDRAEESLAAAALLGSHPAAAGMECGMYGVSQGGWVALIAAAIDARIRFVVSNSGPGVSPAFQDRFRILNELRQAAQDDIALMEAGRWLDDRADLLLSGPTLDEVLTRQESFRDRTWYEIATRYFDTVEMLGFLRGVLPFDPALILPKIQCPVLALLGASDALIPVPESLAAFSSLLPQLPGNPHGIAVFPGAGHGLFTEAPDPAIDRASQLAPGFLPMVHAFIQKNTSTAPS